MAIINEPLVSVSVITYNSSNTVVDTLESIYNQTYKNIELIISDDCSTDETVEVCRDWIRQKQSRFVRVDVLCSEKNTGISANLNRAESFCQGEWMKSIAGDDLLTSTSIEKSVNYIHDYPETLVLFGKAEAFGSSDEVCAEWNSNINNADLLLPPEQLLHTLIFNGNCICAVSSFLNIKLIREYNIHNDERIPMLDDWPRWIRILKAGIKIHFIDEVLALYRVGGGISTGRRHSMPYFRSLRLMRFYYLYPEWQKFNYDYAIQRIVNEECELYQLLLEAQTEDAAIIHSQRNEYKALYENYFRKFNLILNSRAYRIGKIILAPFNFLRRKLTAS